MENVVVLSKVKSWEIVKSYTCLGVPFSSKKFLCHAPRARYKARTALNCIWKPLTKLKIQSMYSRCLLFNAMVKSVYNYAAPIWCIYSKNSHETIQNIFARKLLQTTNLVLGYVLRREINAVPLEIYLNMLILKFWIHILKSPSTSILINAYQMMLKQKENVEFNWCTLLKERLNGWGFSYIPGDSVRTDQQPYCLIRVHM